ncbi:probable fructokinase-1 isoform X1 [Raphanus sativus]|uniref:Probable fructokinase-1 isoform X1 n=1 Tax=Raphanus sativus TaxID=3726 RepID=A0A9W3D5J4_RAPSA|nr:probable fructokinase-1 isoform X1 [Raphanus sativus]
MNWRRCSDAESRDSYNDLDVFNAKVFHYGSIRLIVEPCRSAHLKAMEVAKEAGALLSYDPNLREPLWPSKEEAKTQITSIWEKAEIIKVSDVELEFLTGSNKIDDETPMSLWHPNLKLLLVTLLLQVWNGVA